MTDWKTLTKNPSEFLNLLFRLGTNKAVAAECGVCMGTVSKYRAHLEDKGVNIPRRISRNAVPVDVAALNKQVAKLSSGVQ